MLISQSQQSTARVCLAAAAFLLLVACANSDGEAVRNGPQAQHPSPSALAQGRTAAAPQTGASVQFGTAQPAAVQTTEARQVFETYCAQGMTNNDRVQTVMNSGRFGQSTFGKLPVAGFEDVVFVFYRLKSGKAQIGFGSRRMVENYCIAVDGTSSDAELYIDGPEGRN